PRSRILNGLSAAAAAALLGCISIAHAASPIADAAMNGEASALARLIDQGADVNAAQPDGATALHWAVYRGDLAAVETLVDAGASVQSPNRNGATPLSLACENGNVDVVRLLLDAGADANEALP